MERVYYTINESAAKTAWNLMSFSEYKEDRKTAEYRRYVDEAYELAEKVAEARPEEAERVAAMAERYSRKMAENMNKDSEIGCCCPSILISGAGNFPTKKKEKQVAAWEKNHEEFKEIQKILGKIESILHGKDIIQSDDENAVEKLEKKLEHLKSVQERMREANKAVRMKDQTKGDVRLAELGYSPEDIKELRAPDFCGRAGYPAYALQNNNANIRRIEERIEGLKKVKEKGTQEAENEFFKVKENTEDMRLQLFFEGKPDPEVRSILKSHGFRWSPRNSCWQRQLTPNAKYAMEKVVEELRKETA